MTLPRKPLVSLHDTLSYHCVLRCVRRAFLCGLDRYSGNGYQHRRDWLEDKLLATAEVFAIGLCANSVMSNHYHVVLHVRPDVARYCSDLTAMGTLPFNFWDRPHYS
jgi:REP element-mobilizing transposase RayT